MTVASSPCPTCGHSLVLHNNGICGVQKCKCKIPGITPAQAKVLK